MNTPPSDFFPVILIDYMESIQFTSQYSICSGYGLFQEVLRTDRFLSWLIKSDRVKDEYISEMFYYWIDGIDHGSEYMSENDIPIATSLYVLYKRDIPVDDPTMKDILDCNRLWYSRIVARHFLSETL